jgi:predicted transcriptional regulator
MSGQSKKLKNPRDYSSFTMYIKDKMRDEIQKLAVKNGRSRAWIIKKMVNYCLNDEKIALQAIEFKEYKK